MPITSFRHEIYLASGNRVTLVIEREHGKMMVSTFWKNPASDADKAEFLDQSYGVVTEQCQ
jgi:hypothetical protein